LPKVIDANLLVGTETADDAGVYRLTDEIALVQTLDFFPPVVDDPYIYGQITAANSLSDVYAMGGEPKTAMNLVGFPDNKLPMSLLSTILQGGAERCQAAGCVVVGGHTVRDAEIKFGLSVTGIVHPQKILTNAAAKPGDQLVLTKPLGTGFVTTAHKAQACPEETLRAACTSMITLNKAGKDAMVEVGVHAATDITGFGLVGHAFEMAQGSRTTIVIRLSALPLIQGVGKLVEKHFFTRARKSNKSYVGSNLRVEGKLDPIREEIFYDAQTSGGLLIAVPAEKTNLLVEALKRHGTLTASVIGEVREKTDVSLIVQV